MSAYLSVVTDEKEWEIVCKHVLSLAQGGILVGPEAAKLFQQHHGVDLTAHDGDFIEDYDFGGEAEIWIDVVNDPEGFQSEAILEHVRGLNRENGDEREKGGPGGAEAAEEEGPQG